MRAIKFGCVCLSLAFTVACQSPSQSQSRSGLKVTGFGQSLEWTWNFDRWLGLPLESEGEMGKWASQRKKGSQSTYGFVAPPLAADFTIGAPAVPNTPCNRLVAIPAPATDWRARAVKVSDGSETLSGISAVTPINFPGLAAATTYRGYVAWHIGTARISEWTLVGTFTTP